MHFGDSYSLCGEVIIRNSIEILGIYERPVIVLTSRSRSVYVCPLARCFNTATNTTSHGYRPSNIYYWDENINVNVRPGARLSTRASLVFCRINIASDRVVPLSIARTAVFTLYKSNSRDMGL